VTEPITPETLELREAQLRERRGWIFRPTESLINDPDQSPPIPFGLPEVDKALGGGLRSGLHLLAGYQHNGKTQLLLRLLWENRDKAVLLFSPDEDAEQVMFKLISLVTSTPLTDIIVKPAAWKKDVMKEHFPLLAIDDEKRSKYDMMTYIQEAEQFWQRKIQLCAYDYMGYLASGGRGEDFGGSMMKAANTAKDLTRDTRLPWLFLHQANRSASKGGQLSAASLSYGGEQQAMTIMTVRRPQPSDPSITMREKHQEEHQPTIRVGLIKNKQTYEYLEGKWSGHEVQYAIEKDSGLIRSIGPGDLLMTGMRNLDHIDGYK
jgi:replicative DNA helicase